MKKLVLGLLALFFVVVVVGAWWVLVRPWTAWPGPRVELDARWAEVEGWAGNPPVEPAAAPAQTLALAEGVRKLDAPPEHVKPGADDAIPVVQDPTEGTRLAVEAILTWHRSHVRLGEGCAPAMPETFLPPIETLHAGRAALAVATSLPDDESMPAVLHLASEMRRTGTLVEGVVGMRLAADAVATARSRGIAPGDAFVRWKPRRDEVFTTLARDVVCGYRWVRKGLDAGDAEVLGPRPILGRLVSLERELLMVRTFHADLLHRGHPRRDDPRALAAAVRFEREDLPKSLLVRGIAADPSRPVTDWADAIDEYEAFLSGGDTAKILDPAPVLD